jgi:chromosome segregation ATPase
MAGPTRGARRAFGRARRVLFVPRDLQAGVDQQRSQAQKLETRLKTLEREVAALRERVRPVELASNRREVEHGRVSVQVGVLEQRLGEIEERIATGTFVADDAEQAEARRLVDEVRHEHQQARVRFQIISHYEERLRRVEQALVELLDDGDLRQPV